MEHQDEHARENLAQQRQHDDQRQEAMRSRTESEMHQPGDSTLDQQSRAAMARQRQQHEHLHDTLLERSEEEVQ